MSKSVPLIFAIFFALWGIAAVVNSQQSDILCPDNTGGYSHTKLLEYAALAERAYEIPTGRDATEAPSGWTMYCDNDAPPQAENVHVYNLPRDYIDRAARTINLEQTNFDVYTVAWTGETVIVCNDESDPLLSLAGTVRYAWENDKLSLLTKIILVSTERFTELEEIEVVELRPEDSQKPSLFGIQGTDIIRLWGLEALEIPNPQQMNTSVRQLMGGSCIFNLMPEVAVQFFHDTSCDWRWRKRLGLLRSGMLDSPVSRPKDHAIVGHSLGGAVAQHVANQKDLAGVVRECTRLGTFRAYSFNSIGLTDATPNYRQENIVSVRIAGEVLEQKAEEFDTSQIGHIYRYGLPLPDQLDDLRMERHGIAEVQEQIRLCRCEPRTYQHTPAVTR